MSEINKREIIKIKSTDKKSQGEFVEIYKEDFDKKIHTEYVEKAIPAAAQKKLADAADAAKDAE